MFAPKVAMAQTKTNESPTSRLASQHSVFATRPFGGGTVEQAHFLQPTIGNQAMLRLLTQPTSKPAGDLDDAPVQMHDGSAAPSLSWDFSRIPLFPPDRPNPPRGPTPVAAPPLPATIQPKLAIGDVNDPLEHKADQVSAGKPDRKRVAIDDAGRGSCSVPRDWGFRQGFNIAAREAFPPRNGRVEVTPAARAHREAEADLLASRIVSEIGVIRDGASSSSGSGLLLPMEFTRRLNAKFPDDFGNVRLFNDLRSADAADRLNAEV
jgi:hypothetical protein